MSKKTALIDEGSDDTPVVVSIGGYQHKTTLAVIKALDRAHMAAFDAKIAREHKRAMKARGSLL